MFFHFHAQRTHKISEAVSLVQEENTFLLRELEGVDPLLEGAGGARDGLATATLGLSGIRGARGDGRGDDELEMALRGGAFGFSARSARGTDDSGVGGSGSDGGMHVATPARDPAAPPLYPSVINTC